MTEPVRIVVDTRERVPWSFQNVRVAAVRALPAGDYAVEGFETQVVVERKSLADLVTTVVRDLDRFRRELERLQSADVAAVVIEASVDDVFDPKSYRSTIPGDALLRRVVALQVEFGVPFQFSGSRHRAVRFAELLLSTGAAALTAPGLP